jgi:hypothetical protein
VSGQTAWTLPSDATVLPQPPPEVQAQQPQQYAEEDYNYSHEGEDGQSDRGSEAEDEDEDADRQPSEQDDEVKRERMIIDREAEEVNILSFSLCVSVGLQYFHACNIMCSARVRSFVCSA